MCVDVAVEGDAPWCKEICDTRALWYVGRIRYNFTQAQWLLGYFGPLNRLNLGTDVNNYKYLKLEFVLHRKHRVSITKTNHVILCKEMITFYSEYYTELDRLWGLEIRVSGY
jgi:hypothetical protein